MPEYYGHLYDLELKLNEVLWTMAKLPRVHGWSEISQNTKVSLRYVGKLREELVCQICKKDIGDEAYHYHFKAKRHDRCA